VTSGAAAGQSGKVFDLAVTVRRGDVLHFLGYPEGQEPAERVERLMDDTIREARRLVSARGLFLPHPSDQSQSLGLESIDSAGLVVGLVTIGHELERQVGALVAMGAPTRGLLLDAAGSAAVEEAADRLGAIIAGGAGADDSQAPHVSCRVSPGYGSWSIRAQRALFDVLPHDKLCVDLLPTMLMTPRKSISFAMWLGADRRPLAGLSGCARCGLVECRYRRAERAGNT